MFLHCILSLFLLFVTPLRSLPIEDQLANKELEERHGLDLSASTLLETKFKPITIPIFSDFQLANILKWKAQVEAMGFPWTTRFTIVRMGSGGEGGEGGYGAGGANVNTTATTPTEEYPSDTSPSLSVPGASGSSIPDEYEATGTNTTGISRTGSIPSTSSQACSGPGAHGEATGSTTECEAGQGYARVSSNS
ncbi:MAG: hypothetical protein Q9214_004973 [Letrouitia sp. 1 TL-2023]